MEVKYTSKHYDPARVRGRFVRRNAVGVGYSWCEVDRQSRYDLRQGTANASDLPDDIRKAADDLRQQYFGYVEWPITETV